MNRDDSECLDNTLPPEHTHPAAQCTADSEAASRDSVPQHRVPRNGNAAGPVKSVFAPDGCNNTAGVIACDGDAGARDHDSNAGRSRHCHGNRRRLEPDSIKAINYQDPHCHLRRRGLPWDQTTGRSRVAAARRCRRRGGDSDRLL